MATVFVRSVWQFVIAALSVAVCTQHSLAQCSDWRAVPGMTRADIVEAQTLWDPDGAGPLTPRLGIAGRFTVAGWPNGIAANSIAMWDGTTWQPLGSGLVGDPQYAAVYSLAVYNNELYAGGTFTTAGGNPIAGIARWNGVTWQSLGTGIGPSQPGGLVYVRAMTVYGDLVVAGGFTTAGGRTMNGIARWNGTAWNQFSMAGGTTTGQINALEVYDGFVYAGGTFTSIGGTAASRIARWDPRGAWFPVGGGIDANDAITNQDSNIASLTIYNGELIAGGRFSGAGGVPANSIAAWNGTAWRALGAGIDRPDTDVFRRMRRGAYTLGTFNNQLIVGGQFTQAGGAAATNIAAWNGTSWSRMNDGLGSYPAPFADEGVYSVRTFNSRLFAGGIFPNAGELHADGFCEWDGSRWQPTQGVLYSSNAATYALVPWAGRMVIGGDFRWIYSPGALSFNLMNWDGLGLVGLSSFGGADGAVRAALSVASSSGPPSENLYIAGDFTNMEGVAANRIATRNSLFGIGWEPMGAGFNAPVHAITRFNGSIYAAGDFTASGATPLQHIARWDGTAWQPVGAGINGPVYTMTISNNSLVVGGSFSTAGGIPDTDNLARWNGTAWSSIGGGTEGAVRALAAYAGELHVGGQFTTVRNGVIGTMGYARFLDTGVPWFARSLANTGSTCMRGEAYLTARIATGYGGLNLEWRRNGVRLQDGPTGTGSIIAGSGNFGMAIRNLGGADSGTYELIVTTACGNVTSNPVTLNICVADFDDGSGTGACDGGVTLDDLLFYLEIYENGATQADVDDGSGTGSRDGGVGIEDLLYFLARFNAGC
jgi:hypothetical protein